MNPLVPCPLLIFSIPKPFRGVTATQQMNALRSWTQLDETSVLLFADASTSLPDVADLGVEVSRDVRVNGFGTPLLDHVFRTAAKRGEGRVVCYVNADIILLSDFKEALSSVRSRLDQFLMVGRRRDLDLTEPLDFSRGWETGLKELVQSASTLHSPAGIDYFAFDAADLASMPPFAVGRVGWDNWLIEAALTKNVPVVDASRVVTAVHQNHDYSHVPTGAQGHREGPEARENRKWLNEDTWRFSILSSNLVLTEAGLRRPLSIQRVRRQLWFIRMTRTMRQVRLGRY